MSKYTEHLKLVKPEGNEYYNVEQFNHNAELIDKETKKLSEDLAKVQEGATREKSGIVQFGTEEGKALEGMMLARLSGCIGYGGDIQDDIIKNPNYIYYDRNTRKMYKCLKQNQDISANVANFIPLDNNSLLERLENLISLKNTGNCNEVFNDCLIGIEHWSGSLLRNKPAQDNTNIGTLITFNVGRKTQIYISSTGVYTRVNQATQDENTWTPWVKLS
ncbi:pyocin knob domain-containing protein [Fusobacterium animalis]|uniref:pyocin knob domain-containing protein n=1 Tax=Fusobacterium animalis TaxID=76859 RepID=UPI002163C28C|nr:pyocin knob domain-containing protein [Fusobacterium animalis]